MEIDASVGELQSGAYRFRSRFGVQGPRVLVAAVARDPGRLDSQDGLPGDVAVEAVPT